MGFEGFAGEKEKKKLKEDAESREREQALDRARFGHEKNRLREEADHRREMLRLKESVERGELAPEAVRAAARDAESREGADAARVQEVVEALERAEALPDVDDLLPKALRLTREEYLAAVTQAPARAAALAKVEAALGHLYERHFSTASWLGAALGLVAVGTSLRTVQESQIDAKRDLRARNAA